MTDDDREILQRLVDLLYHDAKRVTRLTALMRAEALDLPDDLLSIINLLPPGAYTRQRMCNQLNSALKGHGWTRRFGTVD